MFRLIKVFIAFLSFSRSLATKCVFLNNKPCMIRHPIIALNPVELNYYSFVIGQEEVVMTYLQKYIFRTRQKK